MLAVIGMIHFSAEAQNREAKKSEFDINYKVCRIDNRIYTTCSNETPTVIYTQAYQKKVEKQEQEYQKTIDGLRKYDSYIVYHPLPPVVVESKRISNANGTPAYSGTAAAGRGIAMLENDGIAKIRARNLNYMNTTDHFAPLAGDHSGRR
jgi:hypothetical protein